MNNRVTRFRRFPAINGDRLGLTDRLIQSQTSVDEHRATASLYVSAERWRPIMVTRGARGGTSDAVRAA